MVLNSSRTYTNVRILSRVVVITQYSLLTLFFLKKRRCPCFVWDSAIFASVWDQMANKIKSAVPVQSTKILTINQFRLPKWKPPQLSKFIQLFRHIHINLPILNTTQVSKQVHRCDSWFTKDLHSSRGSRRFIPATPAWLHRVKFIRSQRVRNKKCVVVTASGIRESLRPRGKTNEVIRNWKHFTLGEACQSFDPNKPELEFSLEYFVPMQMVRRNLEAYKTT